MKTFAEIQQETRTVQYNFLIADLATGNTFLDVACTTHNPTTRARNIENARVAYTTVARFGGRLVMSLEQESVFRPRLYALGERLRELNDEATYTRRPFSAS